MKIFRVFIFISISQFVQAQTKNATQIPVKGYELLWNDEFTGKELDFSKWIYRGLGRRGDAYNVRESIFLNGKGHLVIEARQKGDSVLTGMIATEGIFESQFGYFECKAQLNKTRGIWSAFWLQSSINTDFGTPQLNGVEIDIFEYFIHDSKDSVSHTLHWGGYKSTHKVAGPVKGKLKKTKDNFHTFGLEWTPTYYATYVDGTQTYFYQGPLISKVKEFMILSLHVDKKVAGPLKIENLPDSMRVDYVRVYKKISGK